VEPFVASAAKGIPPSEPAVAGPQAIAGYFVHALARIPPCRLPALGMALSLPILRAGALLALAAVCGGLAFVVYTELAASDPPAAPSVGTTALPPAPAPAPVFTMPPPQSYAAVSERPLFSPSRRPPTAAATPAAASEISALSLTGIIISGDERIALVASGEPATVSRLKEGQTLGGWTVRSIQQDRVVLERDATQQELKLTEKARPAPPGAPSPRGVRR